MYMSLCYCSLHGGLLHHQDIRVFSTLSFSFFRVVFISHDPRKEQRLWFPVPGLKEKGDPGFSFS